MVLAEEQSRQTSWLKVCGVSDPQLQHDLGLAVSKRIGEGRFSAQDVAYIARLPVAVTRGALRVSDQQLEKLRRLCQLADVQLTPSRITSHRRFIGPIIVMAKRLLFSILGVLLKDTLRKQRDFNAAVIAYLTTPNESPSDAGGSAQNQERPKH